VSFLLRWVLPLLLSAVFGYVGINYLTKLFTAADRADRVELELRKTEVAREQERQQLAETLETVKKNAEETDKRREHWRQSYYNVKREYEQYTKEWGPNTYPAELD